MKYVFKKTEVTQEKLNQYSELLSSVFAETNKFTQEFLNWQYVKNPEGTVVGFDAYFDDKLAAHYVAIPVSYLINGKKIKGLLSLNTAVHPKHQGKGLFTQLAEKTFEEGKQLGYEFVVGVANQNSTHGFLKKLGFYLVAALDVKIGLGAINLKNKQQYVAQPFWNKELYQWRFSCPETAYFKQKNKIVTKASGLGVYAQLCDLQESLGNNIKQGIFPVKVWIGLAMRKKNLFINLPTVLKPSPLNLIFKDLKGNLPTLRKEDVFFELIDFDAY